MDFKLKQLGSMSEPLIPKPLTQPVNVRTVGPP